MRTCNNCGFILDTKPGLQVKDGICLACINSESKKNINWRERQEWLTQYIQENKTNKKYDCLIAVSGGKDSHMIVHRLMKEHGIKNPLLVSVEDEFTLTKAGEHNRKNLGTFFGVDHIRFRHNPKDFVTHTRKDFEELLHPLKWFEEKLYTVPVDIAKMYGIRLVFFGENGAFEYGSSPECSIFSHHSDDQTKVIFLGAIHPYSTQSSYAVAKPCGFKGLDEYNEWPRQGNIENYSQIDSIGYLVHIWCKFPKFGFQRVSDMACRHVREGILTLKQATELIKDNDYILDPTSKRDFCTTLGITEAHFDKIVDAHANLDIVHKDCNGIWRRNDLHQTQA